VINHLGIVYNLSAVALLYMPAVEELLRYPVV